MSFSIGGGASKSKTKSSNDVTIDPWSKNVWENTAGQITGLLSGGARPYAGEMSAGPHQFQTDAGAALKGAMNYRPTQVSANSFADADLSKYLNPQTDALIGAAMGDIERSRQLQKVNDAQGATAAGAWGGSRHGVADSLTNEAAQRTAANTAATMRGQAFDRAGDLWARDEANRMQAAAMNQQAEQAATQFGLTGAGMLAGVGSDLRQGDQAGLDRQYADFLRLYEDPMKRAQLKLGLLGATPVGWDSNGTSKTSGSSFGMSMGFGGK